MVIFCAFLGRGVIVHGIKIQPRRLRSLFFLGTFITACSTGRDASVEADAAADEQNLVQGQSQSLNISPKASPKLCLATQNGSGAKGTAVVVSACDGSISQNWTDGGTNSTLLAFVNKCLDVVDGNTQNGARLQIWDCYENNTNQKWTRQGNTIRWAGRNKCLDLTDGQTKDGTPVQLWDCAPDNDNQKWSTATAVGSSIDANSNRHEDPTILPVNSSGYISSQFDPSACAEHPVRNESGNFYVLQLYTCNYTSTQNFVYGEDGSLKDSDSGRCLTAGTEATSPINKERIVTFSECKKGNLSQQWDYYNGPWKDRQSHLCLDLIGTNAGNDARLRMAPCSASLTQAWSAPTPLATPVSNILDSATTLTERCTPDVTVVYLTDDANTQRWLRSYPKIEPIMQKAARTVCSLIFSKASEVPLLRNKIYVNTEWNADGIAATNGRNIYVNGRFFTSGEKETDPSDFIGAMHHELTHFYQNNTVNAPGWVIEGMAETIRYKAGYMTLANRYKGGAYTNVSSYFFIYLDSKYPDLMKQIEQDLHAPNTAWDADFFQKKTGKSINRLWDEYQASF